jgi:hypothetical protein
MPKYAYAEITLGLNRGSMGVTLESTDGSLVREMAAAVRELLPSCRVVHSDQLSDGQAYRFKAHRLAERDGDVAWWMMRKLCLDGREPLGGWLPFDWSSNAMLLDRATVRNWQFRKRIE